MGLKINAYNIIIVTLMAIVGIVLAKMVFTKFKIPGVSDVVTMA